MKISVCIATYNGSKYIEEQIKSILIQLKENDEIIVSDDSSSDNTVEIIEKINDNRIKILKNNLFRIPSLNFENAINHSNGEIIFLADQDDIWMKDKIKTMLKYIKDYDVVISDAVVVNDKMEVLEPSLMKKVNGHEGVIKNIVKNTYYGCCMVFKRKILKEVLPFPKNKEIGHDLWIGLYADKSKKIKFIDDKLIYFRRHDNTQTNITKSKRNIIKKIWGRIVILTYFLKKYKNRG